METPLQEIWRSVAGPFARVSGIAAMDSYAGLSYIEGVGVFYSREELVRVVGLIRSASIGSSRVDEMIGQACKHGRGLEPRRCLYY